jgi:hypothetical protein
MSGRMASNSVMIADSSTAAFKLARIGFEVTDEGASEEEVDGDVSKLIKSKKSLFAFFGIEIDVARDPRKSKSLEV